MKRIAHFVFLLAISLILCSCWSSQVIPLQNQYNEQWRNVSKNDIIRQFGIPNRIVDIEDGESVLVYENYEHNTVLEGKAHFRSVEAESKTNSERFYVEFFLDKDKKCYQVRSNETKEIKKSEPVQTAILVGSITTGVVLLTAMNLFLRRQQ